MSRGHNTPAVTVLVSLEEDMGPQVCCADHVAEQGLAEQGHWAEDVGREPVKWENIGQPAEKLGFMFYGTDERSSHQKELGLYDHDHTWMVTLKLMLYLTPLLLLLLLMELLLSKWFLSLQK